MHCQEHGDVGEPIDGCCRSCLRDSILRLLSDYACAAGDPALNTGVPPLSYIPVLLLDGSAMPCLDDPKADPRRVRLLRALIAHTYVLASGAQQRAGNFTQALTFLGVAITFKPEEHWVLWLIHYEVATALKEVLNAQGAFVPRDLSAETVRMLATISAHLECALRHFDLCARSEVGPGDIEMVHYARALQQQILEMGYFTIQGDKLIGIRAVGTGPITSFLFPGFLDATADAGP